MAETLRNIMATMPYATFVQNRLDKPLPDSMTVHDFRRYLTALRAELIKQQKRTDAEHRELLKLRQDVAGMRRLFGIGDGGSL